MIKNKTNRDLKFPENKRNEFVVDDVGWKALCNTRKRMQELFLKPPVIWCKYDNFARQQGWQDVGKLLTKHKLQTLKQIF